MLSSLKPRPFVQSSFDMQAPLSYTCFCFALFFGDVAFSEYILYHFRFLFVWTIEYVVRSFLQNIVFFYLVTTGWIFDISLLCENSMNQNQDNSVVKPSCNTI